MQGRMSVLVVAAGAVVMGLALAARGQATQPTSVPAAETGLGAGAYPLWDGKESQADYAKRAGIKDVEITLKLDGNVPLKLILIPAGKFTMGADVEPNKVPGPYKPYPAHEVTITRPFYMGIHELTQGQFAAVMDANTVRAACFKRAVKMDPNTAIALYKGQKVDYTPEPNLPVDYLTYSQAVEFCRKLSEKLGVTVTPPTEAQWEYAYRAGTKTHYYWAEDVRQIQECADYAWLSNLGNAEFGDGVKPVGLKKPNPWGLYDMAGNALEFCIDAMSKYTADAQTDPTGPGKGEDHIVRGGYFGNAPSWCTAWHRKDIPNDYVFDIFVKWRGRFPGEALRIVVPVEEWLNKSASQP